MRSTFVRLPHRTTGKHQRGAALFVTLMILLVITVLGIASMRLGLTQSVISRNSTVENLTFQASEAGLNAVMEEVMTCDNKNTCQNTDNVLGGAAAGMTMVRCLTNEGVKSVASVAECGYSDLTGPHNYLDKKGVVRVYTVTTGSGQVPRDGYSTFSDATFKAESTAEIPTLGVSTTHVQEFAKIAPSCDSIEC